MKYSFMAVLLSLIILSACNSDNTGGRGDQDLGTPTPDTAQKDGAHAHAQPTGTVGNMSMMDMMKANMQQMHAIPSSNNADRDFAALMRVHHMGAEEMSKVILAQGKDEKIRDLAERIINEQRKEINFFDQYLAKAPQGGGTDAFYKASMADMDKMNMNMDHNGSLDKQFIEMMIPHHQGAIDMSKAYLANGAKDPALKTMANNIISSQQKEIAEMQTWLNANK